MIEYKTYPERNTCKKLSMITINNADALRRLKEQE